LLAPHVLFLLLLHPPQLLLLLLPWLFHLISSLSYLTVAAGFQPYLICATTESISLSYALKALFRTQLALYKRTSNLPAG
jgi:hypothetical protein